MKIDELKLIQIEWNDINGFTFDILTIDGNRIDYRSFFRISYGRKSFLQIDILFFHLVDITWNDVEL